jgi:hypothetical protein
MPDNVQGKIEYPLWDGTGEHPPFPFQVYLSQNYPHDIRLCIIRGETSRSWISGTPYRTVRISKKVFQFCTPQDVEEERWAWRNRYNIAQRVQYGTCDPAVLRKIADLIGYRGTEKS